MVGNMKLDLPVHKPTWVDRQFLIGKTVLSSYRLGKNSYAFICEGTPDNFVVLKFWYAGNTQYHRVPREDLEKFRAVLALAAEQ